MTPIRAGLAALGAALACWLAFRRHKPVRQPIGGFRCSYCGKPGDSFDDFNLGDGYVKPLRTSFTRENHGTVTRSDRSQS